MDMKATNLAKFSLSLEEGGKSRGAELHNLLLSQYQRSMREEEQRLAAARACRGTAGSSRVNPIPGQKKVQGRQQEESR